MNSCMYYSLYELFLEPNILSVVVTEGMLQEVKRSSHIDFIFILPEQQCSA